MKKKPYFLISIGLLLVGLFLSACFAPTPTHTEPIPTIQSQSALNYATENMLVVCLAQEPDTLHPLTPNASNAPIFEALYDGPIDHLNYRDQPIILTKLPTLADGDAAIQTVFVSAGETIVDTFGNLTALTPNTQYRPAGCQSNDCALTYLDGQVQMNRMIVSFHLREDILWTDGTPLTAQDSVLGYTVSKSPATPTDKYLTTRTQTYEAIGASTTIWTGVPGYLDPAFATNFFMPIPAHKWGASQPAEIMQSEEANRAPLGWGAYQFESWHPGQSITLRKNPRYFRAAEGLPHFDTLVYRFIAQDTELAINMLRTGECDILDKSINLDNAAATLETRQAAGDIQIAVTTGLAWEHLDFGIQHLSYDDGYQIEADRPAFFNDPRTRQAIAHCINRQALADTASPLEQSITLNTYLPPTHPLYNSNAASYTHDPVLGNTLLEAVGWTLSQDNIRTAQSVQDILDGTRLSLTYSVNESTRRQEIAQYIQTDLAQCGIELTIETRSDAVLFANGNEGSFFSRQFDLAQFHWLTTTEPLCNLFTSTTIPGPPNDPAFPLGWRGWNLTGYANPEYDTACLTALNAIPGQPSYQENHRLAQAIFAQDLPILPLFATPLFAATRPDLCNFQPNPTAPTHLWNLESLAYGHWCP